MDIEPMFVHYAQNWYYKLVCRGAGVGKYRKLTYQ